MKTPEIIVAVLQLGPLVVGLVLIAWIEARHRRGA